LKTARADKLVQITEEVRDRARRVLATAMEGVERAKQAEDACKQGLLAAKADRLKLNASGGSESDFHECDAWVRSHEGRVVRAHQAVLEAEAAAATAKKGVEQANIRVEQMCALRENAREAVRAQEGRAERKAEDEHAARATTK
jgi:flagellar export protein FliJ